MAAEGGADIAGNPEINSTTDRKKKIKPRGIAHGLHYEILDDPNIIAESGWENEAVEYWSGRLCKRYVKMYHIDKLWPREAHARHTADFSCKRNTCNDEHFVHRAEEVWRAMFGAKSMSKGYINYTLASMVYAELQLHKKVDWSTFPTTKKNPLLLQVNQKDIPDSWTPEAQQVQQTTILQNPATLTTMASAGTGALKQLDSSEPAPKVINVSASGPSTSKKDTIEEEVARANLTIEHYVHSGALDSLGYVAPNPNLPPFQSPVCSPITEEHPSETNVQQHDDEQTEPPVFTSEFVTKYPHLSSLDLESFKILAAMPHIPQLEGLLDASTKWKTVGQRLFPSEQQTEQNEAGSSNPTKAAYKLAEFPNAALALSTSANWIAELAPKVGAFADELASLSPVLLTGAMSFLNFTDQILPILTSALHCEESHVQLREELKERERDVMSLKDELHREKALRRKEAELRWSEPSQQSDQLSLPQDKGKTIVEPTEGPLADAGPNWLQLQNDLEQANAEKALLQSKLDKMTRMEDMNACMPRKGSEARWLVWVQKLQDQPLLARRAMNKLSTIAMKSNDECNDVEKCLKKFESEVDPHPVENIDITCWGNTDAMMERLNHTKKGGVGNINWALEVEEGWVPYQTLSAHINKKEKRAMHDFDAGHKMLDGVCTVCQYAFGPEGAITMGHCGHSFHVRCIIQASMFSSVCAQCRSPLSPRFYELFGLLDVMPPGQEYNRWTLPLDQGPYEFGNHKHWGKTLQWNPTERRHALYDQVKDPVDTFNWMTQMNEVEIRARSIEDAEDRELFCRSMGGHWSVQRNKFFRFPENHVEKKEGGEWVVVEASEEFKEQYAAYNHSLIGRALFLSKLEEAAEYRVSIEIEKEWNTSEPMVEVVEAFERRIGESIKNWRAFLFEGLTEGNEFAFKMADQILDGILQKVQSALTALKLRSVDLTPKRERKRKLEADDDYAPDPAEGFRVVERATKSARVVDEESPGAMARRESLRSAGQKSKEKPPRHSGEGSGSKRK